MQLQRFALLATVLATTSALPNQKSKRNFVNDPNGNVILTFSDQTVKLGTAPIDTVMDNLASACATTGLCDTTSIDITGYQLVDAGLGGEVDDETVTLTPNGAYPTWIHNGLLDALRAAVKAAATCEDVTNTPVCPNPASYCPSDPYTVNECTVPQFWGITYQDPDASDAAPPFIETGVAVTLDDAGYCATFATIGGAVAGAVNGVAGGIFTLLSLACQ